MSIKDEYPFEKIINLTSIVSNAEDGYYKHEREIFLEFNKIQKEVLEFKKRTLKAFHEQFTCTHEEYHTPTWSLRKSIWGYYYHFEKTCKLCGRTVTLTLTLPEWDGKIPPEGFENAEEQFCNRNI